MAGTRRVEYPEWVKKYLEPGIYVNKVGTRYYLYRAHSEIREGVSHPVRVCDGYIGRVTEDRGLIPTEGKNGRNSHAQGDVFGGQVYAFGAPYAVDQCGQEVLAQLKKTLRKNGTLAYVSSILTCLYGFADSGLYAASWLSLQYPGLTVSDHPSGALLRGIERGTREIRAAMDSIYGENWPALRAYLSAAVLIRMDGRYYCPPLTGKGKELADRYGLHLTEAAATLGMDTEPAAEVRQKA